MKAKKYNWIDIKNQQPQYGIQVQYNGAWLNACEGRKPLLYDNEAERDTKLKEIQDEYVAIPLDNQYGKPAGRVENEKPESISEQPT